MKSEVSPPDGARPRRRIDPVAPVSHAERIAENLRRIAAALPPLPLHVAGADSPQGSPEAGRSAD